MLLVSIHSLMPWPRGRPSWALTQSISAWYQDRFVIEEILVGGDYSNYLQII